MNSHILCPYCHTDNIDEEYYDYPVESDIETTCIECGMKFQWLYSLIVDFTIIQADCLNNGKHQWTQQIRYPKTNIHVLCKTCGRVEENRELWNQLEKENG